MLLDAEMRKANILASLQAFGEDSANGRNRRNPRRNFISDLSPAVCGCLPPGKLLHGSRFTDGILQRGNLIGSLALERVKLPKTKLGKKFRIPKGKGNSRWALSQSVQHIMPASQEDQPNLLFRFQKIAKSIVILCLLYREHHLLANLSYGIERVKRWRAQPNHVEQSKEEILFDVTLFRANKQSRISEHAIHILRQCPQERSEKDISYVLITLQPVKAFGNYSTIIQKKMAKAAWYSRYESCQVMIQQGYTPHFFYICLSGSATVIKKNNDSGGVKPAWFFSQGDAFGDREIINGDCWQTTVIIQESAEFLCIDREDFIKIFLYDGKKVFGDPEQMWFLRSLHSFKGWPIHLLEDNPGKCTVCHYRRGTVILRNSNMTEWIYIVKETTGVFQKRYSEKTSSERERPHYKSALKKQSAFSKESVQTEWTFSRISQIFVDKQDRVSCDHHHRYFAAGSCVQLWTGKDQNADWVKVMAKNVSLAFLSLTTRGLLDFLFEDQPNLCVVSNGTECFKISKKFYLHHASKDLLQRLRKKERSYPSEAELKKQLQQEIQWQIFRKAALMNTVKQIELKRKLLQHSYMSKQLYPGWKN